MDERHEVMPDGRYMEPLLLAAEIIMESGGETFRAEETVLRMGEGFGLREVESFAVPSGLFISYQRGDGSTETGIKRVRRRGTDLTRVDETNRVSRHVAAGEMDCEAAVARLREIRGLRGIPAPLLVPAAAVCGGGFAVLFGGDWRELLVAAAVAGVVHALTILLEHYRMQGLVSSIMGGLLTALLPSLASRFLPGLLVEAVVAGALMPLVPGLAMTNAVQDTMRGDMVSGLSHGAQAILTACLVAGGALIAPPLMRLLTGGGM